MPRNRGTSRKGKPKKLERAAGMGRALERSQQKRFKPKANGSSSHLGGMAASGAESIGVENDEAAKQQPEPKLKSVLEMDNLTDFLGQAEMAQREFGCEKEQTIVLDPSSYEVTSNTNINTNTTTTAIPAKSLSDFDFRELSVPRRPAWDADTSADELHRRENESFLEWRRGIAEYEESLQLNNINIHHNVSVTPFEKNLEVWRQLWRVLERSSCVLQIVDARNPLFYLSQDLRTYAQDELGKPMLLLVNKSDYLTEKQRRAWHEYLNELGVAHVFFSAHEQQQILDSGGSSSTTTDSTTSTPYNNTPLEQQQEQEPTTKLLTRTELLRYLRNFARTRDCRPSAAGRPIEFGTIGFPNVGKSSLINVLIGFRKNDHASVRVAVAAQPGKTKHFQTIRLRMEEGERDDDDDDDDNNDDNMMLCDCPGLVFPSFVNSTADLIAAGVYPIHQIREPQARDVMRLVCRRFPVPLLEAMYAISLERPVAARHLVPIDSSTTGLTVDHLLDTFCHTRKMYHSSSGTPDHYRASRTFIQDYTKGKLLYCHAPPPTTTAAPFLTNQAFHEETILYLVNSTKKLKDRLLPTTKQQQQQQSHTVTTTTTTTSSPIQQDDDEEDHLTVVSDESNHDTVDMLDLVQELDDLAEDKSPRLPKPNTTDRGHKKHGNKPVAKKWGKKGRKFRNSDPYGCHTEPDPLSVVVTAAGKYGGTGYTRPNYAGTNAAVPFPVTKNKRREQR